jgi:DNA-binding IclR family transcriptional regulator
MLMNATQRSGFNASNLERGLDLLELLAHTPEGLGVSEIARRLDIPKNAAFRIASTLAARQYLIKNERDQSFVLSPRLMALGYRAANQRGLVELALPLMRRLRDEARETVTLCGIAADEGVVLDHVPAPHLFRFVVESGMTFPLHASAPGKAILAFLPSWELDPLLERLDFARHSERTITDRRCFVGELARTRARGCAFDLAEGFEGVHCVAAPVFGPKGFPVAAMNLTGPSYRFSTDRLDACAPAVCRAAGELSALLGGATEVPVPALQHEGSRA